MHLHTEPAILYFGTPVVLIGSLNSDGSYNIAPMSSAFWLGWRCVLGLSTSSQTAQNLLRERECVLNLPCEHQVDAVDRLALVTGMNPVPPFKAERGYRHVQEKFERARLSAEESETVRAPRIRECPVQLEAVIEADHELAADQAQLRGRVRIFEARITRVHIDDQILMPGERDRVDPDKWRPLIMSFQQFYGLSSERLQRSKLASIAEAKYRSPDVDRARQHG